MARGSQPPDRTGGIRVNVNLNLNPTELHALMHALDRYLPELEFELARVKLERHRHDLVELDSALRTIRAQLADLASGAMEASPPTPAPPR
jgi:hypothetical protein